jgi:hypothetical protein
MYLFLKFGRMTSFLILVLTNYDEWGGDRSTYFIHKPNKKATSEKMVH